MEKSKIKTGIFGGSFNPIHMGHLALANYLCEYNGLDEIWFLVSPHNPLKQQTDLWDDNLRLELVKLAIADYPKFRASDFEFHLPRPSYTIHTLDALHKAYPNREFTLIIGADNWLLFPRWYKAEEALSFVDSHGMPLDAVAVSCGPGSYTGLRIGVSMAKGICYGRNLPLIGLPTLEVLCVPVLLHHDLPEDALLCPMIDARRMEVYAAVYDRALGVKREIAADIVDEHSYLEFLNEHPVYFFGNGAAKCRGQITHPNAHFIDDIRPLGKWMFPLAEKEMVRQNFKDVAYFEPFYLKEFVPSKCSAQILKTLRSSS
jgi:tRNA threonylcarbamoyladenosine biosynthesis protein TsaB